MTFSIDTNSAGSYKWIIPPGLQRILPKFYARCKTVIDKKIDQNRGQIIIHGDTGVGKSLFTDLFVAYCKDRLQKDLPVTKINCAALPESLIDAELFGAKKGAYTSLNSDRVGHLQAIGDGILVLEEIGELPKHLQAKLLTAIENRTFYRVGGLEPVPFRAIVVGTTNVPQNTFRRDLWHRFIHFSVPPIHQRREDILYYVERFQPQLIKIIPKGIALALMAYNWPGNVREIEMVCDTIKENHEIELGDSLDNLTSDWHERHADSSPAHTRPTEITHESRLYKTLRYGELLSNSDTNTAWENAEDKQSRKLYRQYLKLKRTDPYEQAYLMDKTHTDFDPHKPTKLFTNERQGSHPFLAGIESFLSTYRIGLDCYGGSFYADESKNIFTTRKQQLNTGNSGAVLVNNDAFLTAFSGLKILSKFLFQNVETNKDLLDIESPTLSPNDNLQRVSSSFNLNLKKIEPALTDDLLSKQNKYIRHKARIVDFADEFYTARLEDIANVKPSYQHMLFFCLRELTGIHSIRIEDLFSLKRVYEAHPENTFLADYFGEPPKSQEIEEIPIDEVTLDELEALYLETLMFRVGNKHGSQKRIASMAGIKQPKLSKMLKNKPKLSKLHEGNFIAQKRIVFIKRKTEF